MNAASERMLKHFHSAGLKDSLRTVSFAVFELAQEMALSLDSDIPDAGAEVTTGLRKLREAKDCFVLAKVILEKGQ